MSDLDHAKQARIVLGKAQDAKNEMAREGDWAPLEIAAALQTLYAEAQVHATLALAQAVRAGQPRSWIEHKPRRSS